MNFQPVSFQDVKNTFPFAVSSSRRATPIAVYYASLTADSYRKIQLQQILKDYTRTWQVIASPNYNCAMFRSLFFHTAEMSSVN